MYNRTDMVSIILGHLIHLFNINENDWYRIRQNLDSKCRSAYRRKIKGQNISPRRGGVLHTFGNPGSQSDESQDVCTLENLVVSTSCYCTTIENIDSCKYMWPWVNVYQTCRWVSLFIAFLDMSICGTHNLLNYHVDVGLIAVPERAIHSAITDRGHRRPGSNGPCYYAQWGRTSSYSFITDPRKSFKIAID